MADPLKIIIETTKGSGGGGGGSSIPGSGGSTKSGSKSAGGNVGMLQKALPPGAASTVGAVAGAGAILAVAWKLINKLDEFKKKDWSDQVRKIGDVGAKLLALVLPAIGVPLMIIRNAALRIFDKIKQNSELLQGLKKLQKDAFGAVGDTIAFALFMGYNKLVEKFDIIKGVIDEAIEFAKDPVKYTFEAAWESMKEDMNDAWSGALKIADLLEGWGDLKIIDIFGYRLEVKDLFPPGVWGTVKILDMFHDNKISLDDLFGAAKFKLAELWEGPLKSGDVFKTGGFTLASLFGLDSEGGGSKLGQRDLFDFGGGFNNLFIGDLFSGKLSKTDLFNFGGNTRLDVNDIITGELNLTLNVADMATNTVAKKIYKNLVNLEEELEDMLGIEINILST